MYVTLKKMHNINVILLSKYWRTDRTIYMYTNFNVIAEEHNKIYFKKLYIIMIYLSIVGDDSSILLQAISQLDTFLWLVNFKNQKATQTDIAAG